MATDVSRSDAQQRKRAVRRTTLWLTLLAFFFYGGFILLSIFRAG